MDKQQQLDRLLCEVREELNRLLRDPRLNWQIVIDGSNVKQHLSLSTTSRREIANKPDCRLDS